MSDNTRHYTQGLDWESVITDRYRQLGWTTNKEWTKKLTELAIVPSFGWHRKPDLAFFDIPNKIINIREVKHTIKHGGSGSVDEKFETGPYKLYYYTELFKELDCKVDYGYYAHKNYNHPKFKEVFEWLKNIHNIIVEFKE